MKLHKEVLNNCYPNETSSNKKFLDTLHTEPASEDYFNTTSGAQKFSKINNSNNYPLQRSVKKNRNYSINTKYYHPFTTISTISKDGDLPIFSKGRSNNPLSIKKLLEKRLPFIEISSSNFTTEENDEEKEEHKHSLLKSIDNNIKELKTFYCDKNSKEIGEDYNSTFLKNKNNFFIKSNKISKDESIEIKKIIYKNRKSRDNLLYTETKRKYYENPRSSFQDLKMNKAVAKEIGYQVAKTQAVLYNDKYENFAKKKHKLKLMPYTRITIIPPKESEIDHMVKEQCSEQNNKITDDLIRSKLLRDYPNYHCYSLKQNSMTPNSRILCSLINISDIIPNTILLFGGLSTYALFDFWMYNTKKFTWTRVKPEGENFIPKYGHTTVYYNGHIYIYGGALPTKQYLPLEDIIIFNINKNRIKAGEFKQNRIKLVKRKNHIAEVCSSMMIVHGGIKIETSEDSQSNEHEVLCELMALDLSTLTWSRLIVDYKGFPKPKKVKRTLTSEVNMKKIDVYEEIPIELKLTNHSSCLVLSKENILKGKLNIFHFENAHYSEMSSLLDQKNHKNLRRVKFEGIYIFGGYDETGELNNDLFILHLGRSPLVFYKPQIDGIKPMKRHSCCMAYYQELNYVIIYGGKNIECLNDMFILDINVFNWIEIYLFGGDNPTRAQHSGTTIGNQFIIFGGCNENSFLPAKIFQVDLDIYSNKRKKKIFDFCNYYIENINQEDKNCKKALSMLYNGEKIPDGMFPNYSSQLI